MNIDIKINSAASFTNEASASASLSSASNRLSCEGLPIPAPKLSAASRSRRNLFNSHLPPFVDCQWTSRHRRHCRQSSYPNLVIEQCQLTFSTNLLFKLTQLWLVIVLLVPFLFCLTSISLIRPVSGHDILGPMSNSSNSINGLQLQLQLQLRQPVEQQYQQRVQDMSIQIGVTVNKTDTKCSQQKINNILLNHSNENTTSTVKCEEFESQSYNHRSNNNSLINLSHSEAQSGSVGSDRTPAHEIRNRRQVRKRRTEAPARQQHGRAKRYDKEKLTRLVMHGLGLKKLPDMKKANISQLEYSSKYIEYLNRLRQHQNRFEDRSDDYDMNEHFNSHSPLTNLHLLSIVTNSFSDISRKRWRPKRSTKRTSGRSQGYEERPGEASKDKTSILLHFPLNLNDAHIQYDKIDEANVRLMLLYSSSLANNDPRPMPSRKKSKHKLNGGGNHCHQDESVAEHAESKSNSGIAQHRGDLHRNRFQRRPRILNLKVYQLLSSNKRQMLDKRRIEFENIDYEDTHSQWLEFDVTKAVRGWLNRSQENLGIEIQCDKCRRIGARILSDVSTSTTTSTTTADANEGDYERERFHLMPVLNIIGHLGHTQAHREGPPAGVGVGAGVGNQYYPHRVEQDFNRRIWSNSCYKVHQRCCRHQLDVVFKDIKGFEFILQPKTFDAGYCQGRCPPRHNPAHHHALLQSVIWQQDRNRVPRPCCAPSKLTELEILHVDEEHSDKLKISTWSDMQVVECACS